MPRGVNLVDDERLQNRLSSLESTISPSFVTEGLVLHLDAGNYNSYPGTGNRWYDLTYNKNHVTLMNSPTFSALNQGSINFNGTNQYGAFDHSVANHTIKTEYPLLNFFKSNVSVCAFLKPTSLTTTMDILTSRGGGPSMNIGFSGAAGCMDISPSNGSGLNSGSPGYTAGVWQYYAMVAVRATGATFYMNSSSASSTNAEQYTGPYNSDKSTLAAQNNNLTTIDRYFNGNIAIVLAYNKVLNSLEVAQNFNAFRNRFGI